VPIVLFTRDDVDRHWREYLSKGGAFVAGDAHADDHVVIVLMREGHTDVELDARAVYRSSAGCGYELLGWNAETKASLEAWCNHDTAAKIETETEAETETETGTESDPDPDPANPPKRVGNLLADKLRNLPAHLQTKLAREGLQRERVMLERMYGKNVWEALLRNPRITFPEIARIARMGTLPVPLMELIVNNAAWLRSPEIRRALLANTRLGSEMIPRVLRMLPKHELKLVPTQTAYPLAVRDLARRILRGAAID
jgi:hypothetical protein